MNALEIQQVRLNEIVLRDDFQPVAVVLEGRDTAGKSSTIRELTHYLPTPKFSVVLSTKPSKSTMANWLGFWSQKMPVSGICFYDRSWYSRAMVQKIVYAALEGHVRGPGHGERRRAEKRLQRNLYRAVLLSFV